MNEPANCWDGGRYQRLIGTTLILMSCALSLVSFERLALAQPETKTRYGDSLEKLDVEGVRRALKEGADANERYDGEERSYSITLAIIHAADEEHKRGATPLYRVMTTMLVLARDAEGKVTRRLEEKVVAVLEVLLDAGATPDTTILHIPAAWGARIVTKYLLDRGANPNGAGKSGHTPVIYAIKTGHPEIVSLLVEYGAKQLDPATEAQIRFIVAAQKGDLVAVRQELARGAEVNRKSPTGETALSAAIGGGWWSGDGNLKTITQLLQLGADPNSPNGSLRYSPLHTVMLKPEFEATNGPAIVEALLKAGASVSSTASEGETPLHLAARWENAKAVKILLQAGAKVMPRDILGKTPLDYAESGPVIELLKAAGASEQ